MTQPRGIFENTDFPLVGNKKLVAIGERWDTVFRSIDGVIQVMVSLSCWSNRSHVIIENLKEGTSEYHLWSQEQIMKNLNPDVDMIKELWQRSASKKVSNEGTNL